MAEPTVAEMACAVARELEDETRWCAGSYVITKSGRRLNTFDKVRAAAAKDVAQACAEGHAHFLFGGEKWRLTSAYRGRFGAEIYDDNDGKGREFTRLRLLELAESQS